MVQEYVHRLVAGAYCPNPQAFLEVDHVNGDREDNRSTNLRWADRHENHFNAAQRGTLPYKSRRKKLTDEDIRQIRRRAKNGEVQAALAREYGIAGSTLSLVVNRKRRRNVC